MHLHTAFLRLPVGGRPLPCGGSGRLLPLPLQRRPAALAWPPVRSEGRGARATLARARLDGRGHAHHRCRSRRCRAPRRRGAMAAARRARRSRGNGERDRTASGLPGQHLPCSEVSPGDTKRGPERARARRAASCHGRPKRRGASRDSERSTPTTPPEEPEHAY